ncbi:hypothetical protein N9N32_00285 [Alphaproteobacteria bacterium]|nr:hypothetical protein [Alphaproteobacteria bacterium]
MIKSAVLIMVGISTASFFEPSTLESINQIVWNTALTACDISRAALEAFINLFTGEADVS